MFLPSPAFVAKSMALLSSLFFFPQIAFGAGGFEFGLALGGGPAISHVTGELTSTASGTGTMLIGGQFSNGTHLDLLIESAQIEPLEGAPSEGMLPQGYMVDFGFTGLRLGHRWGRWHIWGDAALGSLYEDGDIDRRYTRESHGHSMFGAGAGFEFAKWESFAIEAYASVKQINRNDSSQFAWSTGRNIAIQNYGLAFNFYPAMWVPDSRSSYSSSTHVYCLDCGYHLVRLLVEVGGALPEIGAAVTQIAFKTLAR